MKELKIRTNGFYNIVIQLIADNPKTLFSSHLYLSGTGYTSNPTLFTLFLRFEKQK
jgi:hypothetical protein